jgi:hypothetical protein
MESPSKSNRSFKDRFFSIIPLISLIGLVVGAIGGYVYYIEIGCNSGSCAITSNPFMSVIWGAVIGYLVFDIFRKKPKPVSKPGE